MGVSRKTSADARPPSRAFFKAHYAEKAWKYHDELDTPATLPMDELSEALKTAAMMSMAANSVKAARMKTNIAARAAYLDDWERRLKQREKQLVQSEDALENMTILQHRRSGIILRSIRKQWAREKAIWYHHGAGLLLLALIVSSFLVIAVHWQVRNWQCNEWLGMACWGVMGYTVIAGMSYIIRMWTEERATASREMGAVIFACLVPFIHFLTCLSAALWSVGMGTMCHAN